MRNKILFLVALLLAFAGSTQAQMLSSNRWLFVVDTSAAMERRIPGTLGVVQGLLLSGMHGQLRRGDTIGLWTFNDELYTGGYALQFWQPEAREALAQGTMEFLRHQTNEKVAHFEKVIPAINDLVAISDILTIVLITDGAKEIHGTPFDAVINATFKQDFRYQKNAGQPFVVVLRGESGKLIDYTVTFAPWLARFPPLPPAPVAVVGKIEPALPQPTNAEPSPKLVVPSLILTGKKPETTNTPAPFVPIVENASVVTLNSEPLVTITPSPPIVETTNTEVANVEPTNSEPSVTIPENIPPPEKPMTQVRPEMPNVVAPQIIERVPSPEVLASAQSEQSNPIPLATDVRPQAIQAPVPSEAHSVSPPVPEIENHPAVPAATPQAPVATSDNPTPVQPAVVTPPAPASGNRTQLFIGLGLVIVALVIGIFWLRRSRPASNGSLITRSLDKYKK